MRVVITSAMIDEWMPCFLNVDSLYTGDSSRFKIIFHQTGVGMLATTVALMRLIQDERPDLVIQAGIAGCFDTTIPLGKVVAVTEDVVGDMGVMEEGKWKDIFDLKLEKSSYHPYHKRKLPNQYIEKFNLLHLPEVTAVTVNEISTDEKRIEQLIKKYNPVIESMEGAALHYVCRTMNIPFMQVRSVSNYIGERNKENWKIKEAIDNLNKILLKYVEKLYSIT